MAMNLKTLRIFYLSVFFISTTILIPGCSNTTCVNFSNQTQDTRFNVGDIITASGINIDVEEFQWGNGTWTSSGYAKISTQNYAPGSGYEINSNNANLHFQLAYPVEEITLNFGELGGNINIQINEIFQNIPDLIDINNMSIGGVNITVNAIQEGNNWYGTMLLQGVISNFSIGGQELWLDDICYDSLECENMWDSSQNLSDNAGISRDPSIAVDGNNIHVVWYDDTPGNYEIFYKHSTDGGVTWSSEQNLSNNSGHSFIHSIAVDGSNVHVVWYNAISGNSDIFYKRSTDGGVTWLPEQNLSNNERGSLWPTIAVSGSNVHVVWRDYTPGSSDILYKQSTDGGITWSSEQNLSNDPSGSGSPFIAADGSNIHVVWYDQTSGNREIHYKRSSDGGTSWATCQNLSNNTGYSSLPSLSVDGDNVHVVWHDNTQGNFEILYKQSTDKGITWSSELNLSNNSGSSFKPAITADGNNIHVVWHDSSPGNSQIFHKQSPNNGGTWTSEENLSDSMEYNYSPDIVVNGNNIYVVWYKYTPENEEIHYKRGIIECN